ncbi:hypothetical protein CR513_20226, partial [Mucuna pruriens]
MGEIVVDRQVFLAFILVKYVDDVMYDVVLLKPLYLKEVCKDQIKMRIKGKEERKQKEKSKKS